MSRALLRAVCEGDLGAVVACLAAGATLDTGAVTALIIAAAQGKVAIAEALLRAWPAAANASGDDAWTPLHHAAFNGRAACCALLIAFGADVDAVTPHGLTPLWACVVSYACENAAVECMVYLLGAGATIGPASASIERASGRLAVAALLESCAAARARWAGFRRTALTLWCAGSA